MKDIGLIVAAVVAFAVILYGVMQISVESSLGSNTPNATITGPPLPAGITAPRNGNRQVQEGAGGETNAG